MVRGGGREWEPRDFPRRVALLFGLPRGVEEKGGVFVARSND